MMMITKSKKKIVFDLFYLYLCSPNLFLHLTHSLYHVEQFHKCRKLSHRPSTSPPFTKNKKEYK